MPEQEYAYCETVNASGSSPWHIRKLGKAGLKLGGGADTDTICGRKPSWDIQSPVCDATLRAGVACRECESEYRRRVGDA